jgi:hypothetical protein
VPISLYISIEIVKTIQAYFIAQDIDMYYELLDAPCAPKTWNISDDLGQIEYIFSDKTGTLTQNIMEFQKCSVHGISYGEGVTEAQRGAATREGKVDTMDPEELNQKLAKLKRNMLTTTERAFKNRYAQPDKLTLVSKPEGAEGCPGYFFDLIRGGSRAIIIRPRLRTATTGEDKQEPVTINEFLLRGCAVRNTSWDIGLQEPLRPAR